MASQAADAPGAQAASFEYELLEGDPDHLRTVVATPNKVSAWIDPGALKLRHRIGRGPFGDVWLATHHQTAEDFEEYHEVAVKMLHPVKEEHMKTMLEKFEDLFSKIRGSQGVCWLHGMSVISGKVCVVMKFYEGSVGDKMARLVGGKLPLPDVLRYGLELARAVKELHSNNYLVLNLKPSNFLLNENDQAYLGDVGIPFLLLNIPLPSSDMARRCGTPSYMAPEQWEPDIRGPLSFETDSWGFGCSIVEMLTGMQPWSGKSMDDIYNLVVRKQEKPSIPTGLPPAVENVVLGCFEYDFRCRPSMENIISVFESSQNAVFSEGHWSGLGGCVVAEKSGGSGYTQWFLSKDPLQVGDTVRSRKPPNSGKHANMSVPEGTVVGLEHSTNQESYVLVRVHGIHDPVRVQASALERVTNGLAAGDWVLLKQEDKHHSSVGILHSISRDAFVEVAFIGMDNIWKGRASELQMSESYYVGQFVKLKTNVLSPRFQWPHKQGGAWATGRISWVLPNGCLVVKFPGRLLLGEDNSDYLADPAEVEAVSFSNSPGVVKKYQHLEDFHWAVRPLAIALGLFTAAKLGFFMGGKISRKPKPLRNHNASSSSSDTQNAESHAGSNPAWLPGPVANIIFREGVTAPTSR
uniref:Protein kinase domain-containing protein n=1 Tax=Kalanchoe fedtschenkoi TaxID=63787 RepID=A0A7N0T9X3_KALFE